MVSLVIDANIEKKMAYLFFNSMFSKKEDDRRCSGLIEYSSKQFFLQRFFLLFDTTIWMSHRNIVIGPFRNDINFRIFGKH